MGRWSDHPMASDAAMDVEDEFILTIVKEKLNIDEKEIEDLATFEIEEKYKKEISDFLSNIRDEDFEDQCKKLAYYDENLYVIPFIILKLGIYNLGKKKIEVLRKFLDYCRDLTLYDIEESEYFLILKNNFEDIMQGKKEFDPDGPGLFDIILNTEK